MPTKCERDLAQSPGAIRPSRRQVPAGQIDVWLARIPSAREWAELQPGRSCLSAEERQACSAFQRVEDRVRAEFARALLRTTLARYAAVLPEAWEFVLGEHGKPAAANPEGSRLRFNLSHTAELVACGVTLERDLGLDLEDARREAEFLDLARRVFADDELAAFEALAPEARQQRFFEHWTLKEAYLKARGLGFSLDPRSASFEFGGAGRLRPRFAAAAGESADSWWFALLEVAPAHTLALASKNGNRASRVRTYFLEAEAAEPRELELKIRASSNGP